MKIFNDTKLVFSDTNSSISGLIQVMAIRTIFSSKIFVPTLFFACYVEKSVLKVTQKRHHEQRIFVKCSIYFSRQV